MADPAFDHDDDTDIFGTPDDAPDETATLRGLADIEAGRIISHQAMKRWLLSWGTDNPLPPPKCGE